MTKLTEQQKMDLFKDAPEGYNYYVTEDDFWHEAWFVVENSTAIKTMYADNRAVHKCGYTLHDLLKGGAIKRPEPKGETNMIYTQEVADNGVLPVKGWSWNTFTY
jgi:hypothetical protein